MRKYDYSLLRGRIIQKYENNKKFTQALNKSGLNICFVTFYSRINGETYFKQDEMEKICLLLDIPFNEIHIYFFTLKNEFNS